MLSALHMNTSGRQFFQVNQPFYEQVGFCNLIKKFVQECYNSLGDLMDMLVLGNSASNFVVYCFMSTKFRRTLLKVGHHAMQCFEMSRVPLFSKLRLCSPGIDELFSVQVLMRGRRSKGPNTPRLTQVSRSSMI